MKKQISKVTEVFDNIIGEYSLDYDYEITDIEEIIYFTFEVFSDLGKENGSKSMNVKVDKECNVQIEVGEDCWEPLADYGRNEINFWRAFLEWPF